MRPHLTPCAGCGQLVPTCTLDGQRRCTTCARRPRTMELGYVSLLPDEARLPISVKSFVRSATVCCGTPSNCQRLDSPAGADHWPVHAIHRHTHPVDNTCAQPLWTTEGDTWTPSSASTPGPSPHPDQAEPTNACGRDAPSTAAPGESPHTPTASRCCAADTAKMPTTRGRATARSTRSPTSSSANCPVRDAVTVRR